MYTRKLDPKTIKIVWVLAAQEHIHTIKNNDMNLIAARMAFRHRAAAATKF